MDLHAAVAILQHIPLGDVSALMALIHEQDIPDACFDLTLCDWAASLLEQEQVDQRQPAKVSWEAVSCKRRWIAGQCSQHAMEQACIAAHAAYQEAMLGIDVSHWLHRGSVEQVSAVGPLVRHASMCRTRAAFVAHLASLFHTRVSRYSAGRSHFYMLLSGHVLIKVEEPSHLQFLQERLYFWVQSTIQQQTRLVNLLSWRESILQQKSEHHYKIWEDMMF